MTAFELPGSEDLEEFLLGEEPPWEDEPAAPPDPERANALLGRLRKLRRERRTDEQLVRQGVDQLGRWFVGRDEPRQTQESWLLRSLDAYHRGVYARSKTATISFPNGELASRQGQPGWEYDDEAAFLAWAETNAPGLVRRPPPPAPEIDKNAVKQALTRRDEKGKALDYGVTEDGERPPGLRIVSAVRKYEVKVGEDD